MELWFENLRIVIIYIETGFFNLCCVLIQFRTYIPCKCIWHDESYMCKCIRPIYILCKCISLIYISVSEKIIHVHEFIYLCKKCEKCVTSVWGEGGRG